MVQDNLMMKAVSKILQRSERQIEHETLRGTFVDVGIIPQLENQNNQILYGRRGTGKTHVFKVLASRLKQQEKTAVLYIDARTLGSTAQFSNATIPLSQRCLALFRDILGPIHNSVLEHIVEYPSEQAEKALESTDELASSIVEPVKIFKENTVSTSISSSNATKYSSQMGIKPVSGPHLAFEKQKEMGESQKIDTSYRVESDDKLIFPSLHSALSKTLELADVHLYILLDEWSSLPLDIQPYLAEFLKKGVLPVQRATIKIASLEHRSNFAYTDENLSIGFELGADVSAAIDLDDYYVFDRNPEHIITTYANILFRHLTAGLPDNHLSSKYNIKDGAQLTSKLFTERATFMELARASEGVVRDLINIFTLAFFNANRRNRSSIDRKSVVASARQWFEQDKAQHLSEAMQVVLRHLVDEVIGKRKARSFLLTRTLDRHPMVQLLFDARVLHLMQRGYADKDNPGVRYNIYVLDYGTYVDLIGTSKQPQVELFDDERGEDVIVPFDDKRSIRRIVLEESILNQTS